MSLPPPSDNCIGEPQYPAPWTTKKPSEDPRDNDAARIVSLAQEVCPVPFPVVDFCGHDENYTPSVNFTAQKAMVMRSNTMHVHGDEPGVGKGLPLHLVVKRPLEFIIQLQEGAYVTRLGRRIRLLGLSCCLAPAWDERSFAVTVDDFSGATCGLGAWLLDPRHHRNLFR
jgi:Domain of unknown function (DUF4150)